MAQVKQSEMPVRSERAAGEPEVRGGQGSVAEATRCPWERAAGGGEGKYLAPAPGTPKNRVLYRR